MDDLLDLRRDIADAVECLRRAARLAYRISGDNPGRAPAEWTERLNCPACGGSGFGCGSCDYRGYFDVHHSEPGEPAEEGWPALVALSATLDFYAMQVADAVTDEVRKAMEDEAAHQDEMSDRADAQSY